MEMGKSVCVIIPLHNGKDVIEGSVSTLRRALRSSGLAYEIIVAEDGSTDGSYKAAKSLEGPDLRLLHSDARLGKGRAIARAVEATDADTVIFMDADMSADPSQAGSLVAALEKGADMAIGSRLLGGSRLRGRSAVRGAMSRAYNAFIRLLFHTGVSDHQCGFKAFRRLPVLPVLREVSDNGWFWDTELIVRAKLAGMRVEEVPLEWEEAEESRFSLASDVPAMAIAAIRLRMRLGGA